MWRASVAGRQGQLQLHTIGIIGVGTMGRGIAEHVAAHGLQVLGVEPKDETAEEAARGIDAHLDARLHKWAITDAEKKAILSRIDLGSDTSVLSEADLVIECVPENLELKQSVFYELDLICPPTTVLASNTSTLSVTQLGAATTRPERVLGLHFLNPVSETQVVEIVRGLRTSNATFERASAFIQRLDKTGIEVYESPGYVTTRLLVPMLNEAMTALMEGVASETDIDTAMRLGYNWPSGPLEMADRLGLDTLLAIAESLFAEYGDLKYRPSPLLRKYVRAGHLGVKVGQGFFRYDSEGRRER